jgi:predicted metal-dependent phosphoesterase TrpH
MYSLTELILHDEDSIDLHLHTIYSDGHWEPIELFDYLASKQFRLVAITDHDRVDRLNEMQQLGRERSISVLSGVEVTTNWHGRITHLLCYGFDPDKGALAELTKKIVTDQLANTQQVYYNLLEHDYKFPDQQEILANTQGKPNRPIDNAMLLYKHGYVPDIHAGIDRITQAGFYSISTPLVDAIAASHADGGLAIIAHPGRGDSDLTLYTPEVLDELGADGLAIDGIEVHYPTHTVEQQSKFATYATHHNWLVSSGSDSHGPRQRYPISYPSRLAAALLERCGITIRV